MLLVRAGLTCSTYFPGMVAGARPAFALLSLLDTCACVGASLASNSATARSAMGLTVLLPVRFHPLPFYCQAWPWSHLPPSKISLLNCVVEQCGHATPHSFTGYHLFSTQNDKNLSAVDGGQQVAVLHIAAYWLGYRLARATVAQDNVPLARCISLETGMQVQPVLVACVQLHAHYLSAGPVYRHCLSKVLCHLACLGVTIKSSAAMRPVCLHVT